MSMRNSVTEKLKTAVRRQTVLICLLGGIGVFADWILYYAAALTLNTLYAGIGSVYVSLIAFLSALGALLGRMLFTHLRENAESMQYETCLDVLYEDFPAQNEADEEMLGALYEDAAHYETKGITAGKKLAFRDILRILAVCVIEPVSGLLAALSVSVSDALVYRYARKHIETAERFRFETALAAFLPSAVLVSVLLIRGLSCLENGGIGLYGFIMILFLAMDTVREHADQNRELLTLRRDLRSIEILEAYENEENPVLPERREAMKKEAPLTAYVFKGAAILLLSMCFVLCTEGILSILSYRTVLSLKAACLCMPACACLSALCYALSEGKIGSAKLSVMKTKGVQTLVSVLLLLIALRANTLLGGTLLSGMLALEAALPAWLRLHNERNAEAYGHAESLYAAVSCILLIALTALGILCYWNAKASFAHVLLITVLYMCVNMYTDHEPFAVMNRLEREGEDER